MSRIYDNQPLRNLPVLTIEYQGKWNIDQFTTGNGVLLEGCIQNRSHYAIVDSSNNKKHYYLFSIKLLRAHRRKIDVNGKEIEPNFSETKKVSTGFLNSSYKVEAKGQTDRLNDEEATAIIHKPHLTAFTQKHGSSDLLTVWMDADQCAGLEFESGDNVRVKTRGDGPFVFSISKIDDQSSTIANYAGGAGVGASWTDKIMDIKSNEKSTDNAGADDDEWDD